MFRTFVVGITENNKEIVSYFVTDAKCDKEFSTRPKAASFPVSQAYPDEMQQQRARDYCDYLNKLVEATKEAYANNQLINVLKA
jgi:hypothetical protein